MTPLHEASQTDLTSPPPPPAPPPHFRERSNSVQIQSPPIVAPHRRPILRSVSYSNHYTEAFEREHHCSRMHIAYRDDALPAHSLANIYQLLRAVQRTNDDAPDEANDKDSNRVLLAKKALRYRRLLQRAEEVDVNDPSFDIHEFLRVRWSKADGA